MVCCTRLAIKRYNFEGFRFDADSGSVIVIQVTG